MTGVRIVGGHAAKGVADFFIRTEVEGIRNESRMKVDFGDLTRYLSARDMDLASIAAGLFECEGLLRNELVSLDDGLEIVLCQGGLRNEELCRTLTDLLSFTLRQRPHLELLPAKKACAAGSGTAETSLRSVCLFSGGIDSLAGILRVQRDLAPTAGIFVSHSNSMLGCVNNLQRDFLNAKEFPIHRVSIQDGRLGLQQMRGFTYLAIAAVVAKMHGTNNIVVSETGQTMFLPPFAALDEITMTTHPTLIGITKSVLHECLGIDFSVFEPFSNLTKAEVVSLCEMKEAIPATNSCRTSRWARQRYSHCGTCYGCLVRRVGCLVAGVKDAHYARDVLVEGVGRKALGRRPGETIQPHNLADLQALLRFARDVLEDELDETTRFKIEAFKKEDLYKRAALDVLVGTYLLYDETKQGHNPLVRKFYEECKNDGLVSSDTANNRIAEVRDQRRQPDFDTKL